MKGFLKIVILALCIMNFSVFDAFAEETFSNWNDIQNYIYESMENRENEISFEYTGTIDDFQGNIRQAIKDSYSKDDYLERSWVKIDPKAYKDNNVIKATLEVSYLTSKDEEEYVNTTLQTETSKVVNNSMSDYEKVSAINKYIIDRYSYDYSQNSISAYTALKTNIAVCQGYSMTAYKMFNDAGIPNRIIVGTLDGVTHSWNMVKVNNEWYNIDITNNDSSNPNQFFLVSNDYLQGKNYVWDTNKYPISLNSYTV